MGSPCEDRVWPQCVRDLNVEIVLSDFPDGYEDGPSQPPDGYTPLRRALVNAYDGHPPTLKVSMPGGWEEEVAVGSTGVWPYPGADVTNPPTRFVVTCDVSGYGVGLNYPRTPADLAALWVGSLTLIALPGGETCRATMVGPYPPE